MEDFQDLLGASGTAEVSLLVARTVPMLDVNRTKLSHVNTMLMALEDPVKKGELLPNVTRLANQDIRNLTRLTKHSGSNQKEWMITHSIS